MKIQPFVAENAAAALAQIHEQLGPDAVVLSLRRLPAHGVEWLWNRKGHVEVLAAVMSKQEAAVASPIVPSSGREAWDDSMPPEDTAGAPFRNRAWHSITWLESMGLLPQFADLVAERVSARHGTTAPASPIAEWSAVHDTLAEFWRPPPRANDTSVRTHVFIGPAGSGKTTVLCKWLTSSVLTEEHTARVWRLDGAHANSSELLSVHCEMLGVPVARFWCTPDSPADVYFVDLPGVEPGDASAFAALKKQLATIPSPHLHLVLNAAYETSVLFEQFHAFAPLHPEDLIFTHLDEERRRVKLWNFVLGTNCPLSFLSAGQRIPGEFFRAESALLFPHEKHR